LKVGRTDASAPGDPVTVANYSPRWPLLYERERDLIVGAIGRWTVDIQHVGSTAVPGLGAKPIIDIMVGLRRFADAQRCIQPLQAVAYECRGEAGLTGRLFFRKLTAHPDRGQNLGIVSGVPRSHHLHLVEHDGELWKRTLLFRDYLRLNPDVARQYVELKRRLALEYQRDTEGYGAAKTPFIESVLAQAEEAAGEQE
jgi:GrpB-like predicted nucleotidyltransferase (UPF0157 family)